MAKFSFEISQESNIVKVKIHGHLDEEFIETEYSIPQACCVKFDLEKLENINSCGIREFINMLKKIPALTQVEYHNCPSFFVSQVNMVNGFLGANRELISVFAPYIGMKTDHKVMKHFITSNLNLADVPKFMKIENEEYEFDGSVEKFFRFLSIK
jgi:hypothetical protein